MSIRFASVLRCALSLLAPCLAEASLPSSAHAEPVHGIAMHGDPALPPDFSHFPYVAPTAPEGGRIVFGVQGTFDTLNPFVVRGIAAQALSPPTGFVFQSLMMRSADEPFSLYAGLAQSIETPDDRSWVIFHLNPAARFADGQILTADDVLFSWQMLRDKGKPTYRSYYAKVKTAEALDRQTVRFDFGGAEDRELVLILGLMPVLPRHATDQAHFEETTLALPLGSGPYRVAEVKPGESILYRKNPDFWGKNLPSYKGLYHPDEIRFDYYRDANTLFEAFKGGLYDVRIEDNPTRWTTGYDMPALREGRLVKESLPIGTPKGMAGFVFNTRKPLFADARVREALGLLFDFDWVNRTLFHGLYKRTSSYFEGGDLASTGLPASTSERALLDHYPDAVRKDILEGRWRAPQADGSGRDRTSASQALSLLKSAGWVLRDGVLINAEGEAFQFECLVATRLQERLALNFARGLERIGIAMAVRLVDDIQYWRRLTTFDYDMIQFTWTGTPSPGNEQYNRWSSRAVNRQGSLNYAGARSPAIDGMIDAMLVAKSREDFVTATRALDRVLLSGFYVVPLFHAPDLWLARKVEVRHPDTIPLFGFAPESFWVDKR
jgi:peptide/nickel transport system substrate-binding protein